MLPAIVYLLPLIAQTGGITVAAASDLAPMETELRRGYGQNVRFSFGASGALLRQIENGAPFDVYLAANEQFVQAGIAKRVLEGPATLYARGRIALWSLSGKITQLEDLKQPSIRYIAIANPAYAPYGTAAKQALERTGLWNAVSNKILYGENIRQTLQYAETGNADAAILSWTLVHHRHGILLPDSLHAPIRQAGAVTAYSKQKTAAEAFLKFLAGASGQRILRDHGLFAQ